MYHFIKRILSSLPPNRCTICIQNMVFTIHYKKKYYFNKMMYPVLFNIFIIDLDIYIYIYTYMYIVPCQYCLFFIFLFFYYNNNGLYISLAYKSCISPALICSEPLLVATLILLGILSYINRTNPSF